MSVDFLRIPIRILCQYSVGSATSAVKRVELPKDNDDTNQDQDKKEEEDGELKAEVGFEGDVDTMKDLRKTFAGIFG